MKQTLCVALIMGVGGFAGLALGLAAGVLHVILLDTFVLGLLVGGAGAVGHLWAGVRPSRLATVALSMGCLLGMVGIQAAEDRVFQRAWVLDLAQSRLAASGADETLVPEEGELAFYEEGGAEALEREVRRITGHGGWYGRWLVRSDAGVRVFAAPSGGVGLPVGTGGLLLWLLGSWCFATWLARGVVRRSFGRAVTMERSAP